MITPDQARRLQRFKSDLMDSLTDSQQKLIADFWNDMRPTLVPVQKMVVDEILKVLR